jgi:DNA polymerase V
MVGAGIHSGDIVVVDRSLEPSSGKVVVAVVDGELTIKRIGKRGRRLFLMAENPDFQDLEIKPAVEFTVWGVVTHVIHIV